jgi:hypothetical protein
MRRIRVARRVGLHGDDHLDVLAIDDFGMGGANHEYAVKDARSGYLFAKINFQNGVIPEVGVNGITIESLLAICHDRLTGFQNGKFENAYNANALVHLEAALNSLKARTRDRKERNVEGTFKR